MRTNTHYKKLLVIGMLFLTSWLNAQTIRYVKKIATGTADGLTWANASDNIQVMLTASISVNNNNEVWVAKGVYKPSVMAGNGTADRDKAFVLPVGVKLRGGFVGTETALVDRNLSITANKTTLSGDIDNVPDTIDPVTGKVTAGNDDNAYHVVIIASTSAITNATQLDGFTVVGGNANSNSNFGSITVNSITVSNNNGGGVYSYSSSSSSSPSFTNCTLSGNSSKHRGGGIFLFYFF